MEVTSLIRRKYKNVVDKSADRFQSFLARNSLVAPDLSMLETAHPLYNIVNGTVNTIILTAVPPLTAKIPFVLNQGSEGTCVANAISSAIYASLPTTPARPVGVDLTKSPNLISRCCQQFAENMVRGGFNPAFTTGNPLMISVVASDPDYASLFAEGSWFSIAVTGMMGTYIPSEAIWTYPQPWEQTMTNYYDPTPSANPLLTTPYTPLSNGKYTLSSATCFSANYGVLTYSNPNVTNNSLHYLNVALVNQLIKAYTYETVPLIAIGASANQNLLLHFMYNQLVLGNPLLISFSVEQQFENIGSDGLYIPSSSSVDINNILGGHANIIIGIISGATWRALFPSSPNHNTILVSDWLFVVQNSWSTSWGAGGYWYIRVHDFFNTTINQNIPGYVNTLFTQTVFTITATSK